MSETVQTARAMLSLFAASPWRDLHVRTAKAELFIAKADGAPNPMTQAGNSTVPVLATTMIRAPHLASVVSVQPTGTAIAAGETVAVIELLGEQIDVHSNERGVVASVDAQPGDLIEFEQALATLTA